MNEHIRDRAPKIADRSTFQAELDALRLAKKLTHEKAMPLQPSAGGSPWSRSTARRRSLANVDR
jgi:hypothetical protein